MRIGNITALEAFEILTFDPQSILIDVRCDVEWQNVGKPKLSNPSQLLLNSLKLYPLMSLNQNFIKVLLQETANKSKRIFLCRYGARSLDACNLALANGVDNCYNIIDGFDGNQFGPGWQGAQLPVE